jgi:RND family efflux transporter MFP subunit
MLPLRTLAVSLTLAVALAGCQQQAAAPQPPVAYVRIVEARAVPYNPVAALTGEVRARHQSDLAFRVPGRIVERLVDVGQEVAAGQSLARLDPQEQEADLEAALASVRAAEAQLRQAEATYERQRQLIAQGFTTRRDYDAAEATFRTAQGTLQAARAQASAAQDTRGYTLLVATAPGVITARLAEVGQVVQAAQPVFTLAQAGERDAVFAVQESLFLRQIDDATVRLALISDPTVTATGRVREVAPSIDAATGTVRVTIGIDNPPREMTLGAVLEGTVTLKGQPAFVVPWMALTSSGGRHAVWVMEKDGTAALRPVTLIAHETERAIIGDGLSNGDSIITDGTKLLRPGQNVSVLKAGGS